MTRSTTTLNRIVWAARIFVPAIVLGGLSGFVAFQLRAGNVGTTLVDTSGATSKTTRT
jgi:hypothetical protein